MFFPPMVNFPFRITTMVGALPTPSILSRQKGVRLFTRDVLHEALFTGFCTTFFVCTGSMTTSSTGVSCTESGDSVTTAGEAVSCGSVVTTSIVSVVSTTNNSSSISSVLPSAIISTSGATVVSMTDSVSTSTISVSASVSACSSGSRTVSRASFIPNWFAKLTRIR